MKNKVIGECLVEMIGTLLFVFIGIGSVAVLVATKTSTSYFEMAFCWGVAVSLGIYVTGFVSGGHLNPAVTLSLAVWHKFPWKKVIPYIVAQVIGGFLAACAAYGLFRNTILSFETSSNIVRGTTSSVKSASIFATFPGANVSLFNAFWVEFSITLILMLMILSVTDVENEGAPKSGVAALIIGLTVTLCGFSFGPLTGFAMNPARDFGPRVFTLLAGWKSAALGSQMYGLIVPIFGPILGAIAAGACYFKLIQPWYKKN